MTYPYTQQCHTCGQPVEPECDMDGNVVWFDRDGGWRCEKTYDPKDAGAAHQPK